MNKYEKAFKGMFVFDKDTYVDEKGIFHYVFKVGYKTDLKPRAKYDLWDNQPLIRLLMTMPMLKRKEEAKMLFGDIMPWLFKEEKHESLCYN